MSAADARVAVVTGAGSGIGRAAALALLEAGWRVALAGRRRAPLEETARDAQAGQRALVVPTDVTDEAQVQRLFAACRDRFGRVDLLFNNAGAFGSGALLEDVQLSDWQAVVDVNLTGVFLCLREAFRAMKAQSPQGGRVINNGSISAHAPRPNSIAYTGTKHAVTGLTRAASLDGRKYGIAVSQIDVGNAATTMIGDLGTELLQANGERMAEPKMDVAIVGQSVLYMASLPPEANVLFHTVMATRMPFVGRG